MSDDPQGYQATPSDTLEQHIMDPRIAKSEAEWWAAREIDRLRAEINSISDDVERLSLACAAESDDAERLRARVAELEAAQEWRPLYEEAKDEWIAPADVDVLLFMPSTHPQLPAEIKAGFARSTKGGWFAGWATHWLPLPAPPKEGT